MLWSCQYTQANKNYRHSWRPHFHSCIFLWLHTVIKRTLQYSIMQLQKSVPDVWWFRKRTGKKYLVNILYHCNISLLTGKTDTVKINCISTFEGVYQFTYEVNYGGGGICDSPDSQITACQDPGSSYIDNQVFRMTYGRCRDVVTSFNKGTIFLFPYFYSISSRSAGRIKA